MFSAAVIKLGSKNLIKTYIQYMNTFNIVMAHVHYTTQLSEKYKECQAPLYLAFVNCKKQCLILQNLLLFSVHCMTTELTRHTDFLEEMMINCPSKKD